MSNIHQFTHPLISHYIAMLRDINLSSTDFRGVVGTLANILLYEALRERHTITKKLHTWKEERSFPVIDEQNIVLVPILRAGLPMLDGILQTLPYAQSGFLAMKRDEATLQSHIYYDRIPDLHEKTVFVLDPMVATGGSLCDAVTLIKSKNPKQIVTLNLVGSPVGIEAFGRIHPDIPMYIAQIDEKLGDDGYIYPGIGDAGDRAYNTLG